MRERESIVQVLPSKIGILGQIAPFPSHLTSYIPGITGIVALLIPLKSLSRAK